MNQLECQTCGTLNPFSVVFCRHCGGRGFQQPKEKVWPRI